MSSFRVVEHKIPAQHIRQFRQATAHSQEDILYLVVKQYIPLDNPNPKSGDVTIIGAHANAFPKEIYEPLWDDLQRESKQQGWSIRSIWIADLAHQGQSGLLNEHNLGNEPGWLDHSRDLLHLINLKREEMPQPIVGIGHSVGGAQLAYLSLIHPRLLYSLVLIDPTIGVPYNVAEPAFDARWNEFGLRDTPTTLYPDAQPPQVTLTTSSAQEVFTYLRPNYEKNGRDGNPINRSTHADIDADRDYEYPFYRPESQYMWNRLPELRPTVLYIFGGASPLSSGQMNEDKLAQTGSGIGGSGGVNEGRVKGVTLDGVGHLVAMEAVGRTAEESSKWLADEMRRFRGEEMRWQERWRSKSLKTKQELDDTWKEMAGRLGKKGKL